MFALCAFFGEISGKDRVPLADVFGSVVKSIAQVSGTSFLHMRVTVFELSGLISRRRHTGIGQ